MNYSLNALYREMGTSRQAVQQAGKRQAAFDMELADLVKEADVLKGEHPGCGVEKMYYTLSPRTMGRDRFCEIFLDLGYGVRRVRNHRRTTVPGHIRYPDLTEGLLLYRPGQLLQSDLTYFELNGTFYYIVFIIDVYTREILAHKVSRHQRAEANLKALREALSKIPPPSWDTIHHSDRGSQYGSHIYRKELNDHRIHVSMCVTATANAYAERVNGIIKNEYLHLWGIRDFKDLERKTKRAVGHYNDKRKHRSHDLRFSPLEFKGYWLNLPQGKKPLQVVFAKGNPNLDKEALKSLKTPEHTKENPLMCPINVK